MTDYPSLDAWAHKRVATVELDEETKADVRLPELGVWLAQGRIPNPLRSMAEQLEYSMVEPAKLNTEERKEYYDLQAFIIATHLVKPNLIEELGSQEAAAEWVLEEMPPVHKDKLWMQMLFHFNPEELMRSLSDLAPFREEQPELAHAARGEGDEPGA